MRIYAPLYYKDFHCIAGRCRHTCCAGWDVDIDAESLERYRNMSGAFADHLKSCIDFGEDPHFILTEEKRCPLLNRDNLCELILQEGEEALCQICRDHPRFRNFWTDRIEVGLGLACEEAARLILTQKDPFTLVLLEEDGSVPEEKQNEAHFENVSQNSGDFFRREDLFEGLPEDEEYLMQVREQLFEAVLKEPEAFGIKENEGPLARFAEYLIYRYIADALYDDRLEERICFIQDVLETFAKQWQDGRTETLAELVRAWSAEVEYDTDRINDTLDKLSFSEYNETRRFDESF